MALPNSGPLSLADIQTEFGGSNPASLTEYYGVSAGIPASGVISISDFYGTSSVPAIIKIRAWGARGGYHPDYGGSNLYGQGRECWWEGSIGSGTVLYYQVGGYGGANYNPYGAGGGAGSSVYLANNIANPLIISGGGGAGGINWGLYAGQGGHASNGPGKGGDSEIEGFAEGGQGGSSSGGGGARGYTRGAGRAGYNWTDTGSRGRGGHGGDGAVATLGGSSGLGNHLAGGYGSSRAGDGGGGGGGGGYGGGGGGGSFGYPMPGGAGSSQVFNQSSLGATYQSSGGGGYGGAGGGQILIYLNGTLVVSQSASSTGFTGNYTVP